MAPKKQARQAQMAGMAAREEGDIRTVYFGLTDDRRARVNIASEARGVIREFLEGLDENLTIVEVKAALEGEWQ